MTTPCKKINEIMDSTLSDQTDGWLSRRIEQEDEADPLTPARWDELQREHHARLEEWGRPKRERVELPELDFSNPAFKRTFEDAERYCNPDAIKTSTRRAHLLLLLGGHGNGKKAIVNFLAAMLRNAGLPVKIVPWTRISHGACDADTLAHFKGVLFLTDFAMGEHAWPNKKEEQADELLYLLRERTKKYTIVTTTHSGKQIADVSKELHSAIVTATNYREAALNMELVPQYRPREEEPAEADCFA